MDHLYSPITRQYVITLLACLSSFCFGMDLTWTSPILPKLRDKVNSVLNIPITDEEISWVVSTPFISILTVCLIVPYVVNRIGRRNCIMLSSVPRSLCYILMLCATNAWMIVFARVLSGCAGGIGLIVVPAYVSEISSKERRGRLCTFTQVFTNLGVLVMYAVGPYLSYMVLNLMILTNCFIVTIPWIFIPDSPYSLFSRGKTAECKKVLLDLRGTHEIANEEINDFAQLLNTDSKSSLKEVLKSKIVIRILIIVFIMGVTGNWIGYIVMQEYLQSILESTGSNLQPELSSVIVGIIQFISCIFAAYIMDKFNRKTIMLISLTILAIGMVGLGTFFWRYESGYEISSFFKVLPLISIILVFISYNGGIGSMLSALASELFDGPIRATGLGCAIISSSISGFTVTFFMKPLIDAIGSSGTFWLYGCICLLWASYIMIFIPETKGKSFNEIQIALGKKILENGDDVEECSRKKYVFD